MEMEPIIMLQPQRFADEDAEAADHKRTRGNDAKNQNQGTNSTAKTSCGFLVTVRSTKVIKRMEMRQSMYNTTIRGSGLV